METNLLTIAVAVYLSFGLLYAIYIVLNKSGGIFSIPINALLGPVFLPIFVLISYFKIKGKREVVKKLPPLRNQEDFDVE